MNSLAFLGFHDIHEIEIMPLVEYQIRMEAYQLQTIERRRDSLMVAYFNRAFKATKGSGKHIRAAYEKPEDVYDADAAIDKVRGQYEPTYRPTSQRVQTTNETQLFNQRLAEYRRLKKSGRLAELKQKLRKKGGSMDA